MSAGASKDLGGMSQEQKKELLVRLLREKGQGIGLSPVGRSDMGVSQIVPEPAARYDTFPLTDIQYAYWIGRTGAFEMGNVGTHVYLEFDLPLLDIERINVVWEQLIARHDMLRAIVQPDGLQKVLRDVPAYVIRPTDLRGCAGDQAQQLVEENRQQMSHKVYRTDQWPLFEVRAFRLEEKRMRYCISFDLLILDLVSFQILLTEWLVLYDDPRASLAALEITFRDYVLAEAAFRNTEIYQTAKEYWWKRVPRLPPAPSLPVAKRPGALTHYRFKRRATTMGRNLWQQLKDRARKRGLTPASVLLAAFAEILDTWGKSPRFTLNLIIFNRLPFHRQINQIVGDFTSIDLLEVDHSMAEPFAARAERIQKQLWADLEHRHISGVQVLREIARKHGWEHAAMPVVFTCDIVQGATGQDTLSSRFPVEVVYGISQTPQVWLDHQVYERGGALCINWDAVEELFPEGLIDEMFTANIRLLECLAESEEVWNHSTIELTPSAQLQLRSSINATDGPSPEKMLHNLFKDQVCQRASDPAILTKDRTVTYDELYRRANKLGRTLRALGARPNTLVAVVMDKGWEQVVAVLGILEAGAAYLPIDSELPQERQWYLMEDGNVSVVVTQPWLDENLVWPDSVKRICIDDPFDRGADDGPLEPVQQLGDLAYVIYTSGSTGSPKGVMIDHRGAVNTLCDINRRFNLGPNDRVLALSSLNFDLSVYDIFGTLAAGGTIVFPEASGRRDPSQWIDLMARFHVTVWNSVPALMTMAVDYLASHNSRFPESVRLVLLSGDWIPVALPGRIETLAKGVQVISLGGATEASIWSIHHPIQIVDPSWDSVPYGRPLLNQRFHVLDHRLEPCPVWVTGQLYIGGVGLAKGYWRDIEKTSASFFTHPRTGERLYRTGDRGCYLPDGNIKFQGRDDFQVKIFGHRIELEGIEAHLQSYPGVGSAAAIAVGEEREKKRIIGFVTPDRSQPEGLFDEITEPLEKAEALWQPIVTSAREQAESGPFSESSEISTILQQLEEVSTLHMCQVLESLGMFAREDEAVTVETLLNHAGILPRYRKLMAQWMEALQDAGFLERQFGQTYIKVRPWPDESPSEPWRKIEASAGSGGGVDELLRYVRQSAENLVDMLTGKADPLKLFFPDGSWERAETLYELNPAARYINNIVSEIVRMRAQKLSSNGELQVLEIGAGTGGTTAFLLPVLPTSKTRYVYTDVSVFFTNRARAKFASYPFVEYGLLDIDRKPQDQGFEPHSFDLIVAANVLHDARDLNVSLQRVRELLTLNGLLILVEATRNVRLQMITVGLLEGLSGFEDERQRKNLPFLSVEEWKRTLLENGFESLAVFPEPESPAEALGVHVLLGRAPASVRRFNKERLIHYLKERLPEYEVPADVVLLDELPLSPNGKLDRKALPVPGATTLGSRMAYTAPQSATEKMLADIWSKVLRVEKVGIHDNFFELGGDSLIGIQLVTAAHDAGLRIDPRELFQRQTIAELAPLIEQDQAPRSPEPPAPEPERPSISASCLVQLAPGERSQQPLFLVHPSTGNVECYLELACNLTPGQAAYGIESPQLSAARDRGPSIEEMAADYLEAIQGVQPDGAYFLCGWSMGGIIAFEMAQQLIRKGKRVGLLALLDIGVADFRTVVTETDDSSFLSTLFAEMSISARTQEAGLSLRDKAKRVVQEAQAVDMLPSGLKLAHLRKYLELSKKNIRAMQCYEAREYPGRITLLKAEERLVDSASGAVLGWDSLAGGGVEVRDVPGNHFSMLRLPHAQAAAHALGAMIQSAANQTV